MPESNNSDQPQEATADETRDGHRDRPDDPRWFRALVYLASKGKYLFGAAALVSIAALAIAGVDVPRSLKILGAAFVISTFTIGKWTAGRAADLFDGPGWVWLVDVDLLDLDGAGIYRWPRPRWKEVDVTEGELYWSAPNLAFGKRVDLEANTVEGVWPGTLDDRELMTALSKVHELRNILEEDAKRGFALETQAFSIVRSATRQAVMRVVKTFEESTLPDQGQSINQAIDDALDQFDQNRFSSNDEPADDDLDDLLEQSTADAMDQKQEAAADD